VGGIFGTANGTSFSAPIVTGSLALLRSARPGLTVPEYKSLIVNTATPFVLADGTRTGVMQSGNGMLNVDAALQGDLVAFLTSVSFGAGTGAVNQSSVLELKALAADTWQVIVEPHDSTKPAPTVSSGSLTLAAGQTSTVSLAFSATGLAPGEYQGFVLFRSASGASDVRVPYWYGATTGTADILSLPLYPTSATSGSLVTISILVTDAYGIRQPGVVPTVVVGLGGGSVVRTGSDDAFYPGVWYAEVRLGPRPGTNTFIVTAGNQIATATITGN